MSLRTALTEARGRAPGIAEARARESVAQGEVGVARSVTPLTLSVSGGGNDPRWSVGASQRFSAPGSRSARILAAELGARGAGEERRASEASTRAETRQAYFSLVRARQLAATMSRAVALARESEAAARLRFETGASPELDFVQASVARATAEAQLLTQQGEVAAVSAGLALLLGRDPRLPLEPAEAPPPSLPSLASVLERAEQAPLARARASDIAAAEASLHAASRERWPAPTVGVAVEGEGPRGASAYLRGALDLEVPVVGRGEVDRAEASLGLARVLAEQDRQRRTSEIVAAHQRLTAALAALERFMKEVLPAVERTERMALEAYRTGRSPLVTLNDALRASADTRAQAVEAAYAAQAAFASLELAVGVALDEN
ncbi:TolC family protein [Pyxidicoccus parkwayensis]|uniref:TolC family protein n=1 Tax=Pyxidicoccus parkwayensis TaxID=2813578 RepID=A0ABX7P1W9_9BACT|nr:TolC family protein [Pyxidicoccus parkwaysis]QSQ24175.1 TolC family protein [Pyxidicoccus parkwaysis]